MDDIFGDDRNPDEPRVIFANLRRPNHPILLERGYAAFSAISFTIWTLVVFFVWIFHIEVSLSQDLIVSLAQSSVGLSALSLAVLGIIHELNKVDKWFKLGLLLVAILFLVVVFGGFSLAVTWQRVFNLPQQITVIVVAVLGVVTLLQINWNVILRITPVGQRTLVLSTRAIGIASTFVVPICFLWFPGLNRLTAIVVLFGGALITLTALASITAVTFLTSPSEPEPEDPFIITLRKRYEGQINSIVQFGELKARTIEALQYLQVQSIQEASREKKVPSLIKESSITVRLRQMGSYEDHRALSRALSTLVNESKVLRSKGHMYWTIPDKGAIESCLKHLNKLALIYTEKDPVLHQETDYFIQGYKLTNFRRWLAIQAVLPELVVGEYVMPTALNWLLDDTKYRVIKGSYVPQRIFVSRIWRIPWSEWQERMQETGGYSRKFFLELPHVVDDEAGLDILYHRSSVGEIVDNLTEQFGD
jgi:hypothetical protein